MKYSKKFNLNLPELDDQYNLEHWNQNTRKIDEVIPTAAEIQANINNALSNFYNTQPFTAAKSRFLRFDFTDPNHKSLVITGGTSLIINGNPYQFDEDTSFDLSENITSGGTDYFIHAYVENETVKLIATKSRTESGKENSVYIGRLHTLCNAVDVATTMTVPASPSSGLAVGDKYLVKPYSDLNDADFYNFYNKSITNVLVQTYYDVITTGHPLAGFRTGDILPESVFCLGFYPSALYNDAMVYDVATDIACDVYLQSGTGLNTRSAYGAAHTVSRQAWNHEADLNSVGKRMLKDFEFTSCALGSNERTSIVGSADKSTVGGHIDTNSRRMISAIGVEEMCGYLWQWVDDKCGNASADVHTEDGHGSFGQAWWNTYQLLAGGNWDSGSRCGSRCRLASSLRSVVDASIGSRGSSQIVRGVYE